LIHPHWLQLLLVNLNVIELRKDGRTFALLPEKIPSSPLDVPSIKANITTQEVVDIVREGRRRISYTSTTDNTAKLFI
jgi:hypothetical protein